MSLWLLGEGFVELGSNYHVFDDNSCEIYESELTTDNYAVFMNLSSLDISYVDMSLGKPFLNLEWEKASGFNIVESDAGFDVVMVNSVVSMTVTTKDVEARKCSMCTLSSGNSYVSFQCNEALVGTELRQKGYPLYLNTGKVVINIVPVGYCRECGVYCVLGYAQDCMIDTFSFVLFFKGGNFIGFDISSDFPLVSGVFPSVYDSADLARLKLLRGISLTGRASVR